MAISVENGPPSNGAANGQARDDVGRDDMSASRDRESVADGKDKAPSIERKSSNLDIQQCAREGRQLLSPSPSPRNLSPSLVISDSSRTERKTSSQSFTLNGLSSEKSELLSPVVEERESSPDGKEGPVLPTPPRGLQDVPERLKKRRKSSLLKGDNEKILKLTAAEMEELTSAPESLPVSPMKLPTSSPFMIDAVTNHDRKRSSSDVSHLGIDENQNSGFRKNNSHEPLQELTDANGDRRQGPENYNKRPSSSRSMTTQPPYSQRMASYSKQTTPGPTSPKRRPTNPVHRPESIDLNLSSNPQFQNGNSKPPIAIDPPSPMPPSIPIPPMSIPTYLQLELSSGRPSPLYIYRSSSSEFPYESSKIKFERLLNFLLLPPQLESVLYFGSLACLDAWLYTFTILPLRFFKAAAILITWWFEAIAKEVRFVLGFIWHGAGRMWHRRNEPRDSSVPPSRSASRARRPSISTTTSYQTSAARPSEILNRIGSTDYFKVDSERRPRQGWGRRHRRSKSQPSSLSSYNKADLLQGAVIVVSCVILMKLDASRMYHSIRAQSAIKLYVIYNGLEVFDRLFSALGQDIFECLFSDETLERDADGRSKILRPLGMFVLALAYNVVHAAALLYQVITLNVAVNSYSNALLTLLLSNQFVEIKSTVFKKFEKDNLFQLTCADVVERFQLWLMLTIIGLRNIVEVGGLSSSATSAGDIAADAIKNSTIPLRTSLILPNSFTILPSWSGEVLSPFLVVLGSEMLVDWVKHAYISKFNNVKPAIYQRYLDVLAKDYYTNAFVNQNLIKRLGLPVIPLSCLFIRASVQTYHMFLATHIPSPIPSTATSLSVESSPATTAALEHFDTIIRKALGRNAFGIPDPSASTRWYLPSADDVIASMTMLIFFLGAFLVLLACKLVLGMLLLKYARNRYRTMKKREKQNFDTGGKRVGGWGMVEVDEDKRRWIYDDDPEQLRKMKEKERAAREKAEKEKDGPGAGMDFAKISRYEMAAKRIW